MMQKAFVFVVCGAAEHLNMLKESYAWLAARTKKPIYVVTDSKRNEWPLQYPNLIDIAVDSSLNNHQAAIWLKTSLHRILPENFLFVYLDTDVLAWSENIDEIFDHYLSPVTFAPDHCKMKQFSPYAVKCGCLDMFVSIRNKVNEEIYKCDYLALSTNLELQNLRRELLDLFASARNTKLKKIIFYLRYLLSWPNFYVGNFFFDKRQKCWKSNSGEVIMLHISLRKIAKKLKLRWNIFKQEIQLPDGRAIFKDSCSHLQQFINKKFSVNITDLDWQHWNGGVFIFHTGNNHFMQTWHELTMKIFNDSDWETRDQGTLIATVWKLGLQHHPLLSTKWNLIIDYFTSGISLLDDGFFIIRGKKVNPFFIHVYHHFGDTSWSLWNKIMSFKPKQSL